MIDGLAPNPIEKPDIVVPDAAPLIHLARAGLLHLLHEVGGVVVLVDMVAQEVTRDMTTSGAAIIREWMNAGRQPGSNRPIRVEETETGRLYAAVLETRPDYKLRNGGETAIVEWLAETIAGTDKAVIVLYENGRVPTVVRNQSLDADIDVLTTRAFLAGIERRENGDRPEQETYWARVIASEPTTNPRIQVFS
jgi:hypothetical protein